MATAHPSMKSVHAEYPDNDEVKEVVLEAVGLSYSGLGDRHVLIMWLNAVTVNQIPVTQITQLTGQAGNYQYYAPLTKIQTFSTLGINKQIGFLAVSATKFYYSPETSSF